MNDREDLWVEIGGGLIVAIGGGLIFVIGWVVLELLFASEPSVVSAVVAGSGIGLAWFVGTLLFRKLRRKSESDDT